MKLMLLIIPTIQRTVNADRERPSRRMTSPPSGF